MTVYYYKMIIILLWGVLWWSWVVAKFLKLSFNVVLYIFMFMFCTCCSYVINDNLLLSAGNELISGLGIFFDRELNFHFHLDKMCCKPLKFRFLWKNFVVNNKISDFYKIFELFFCEVDFGVLIFCVGSSCGTCGMNQIELVQRKFLNFAA